MAVSGQSNFGKFIEAAEWAAELSGEAQLILRGLETHAEWSMLLSDLNLRKLQITTDGVVDVFPVSCGHNERLVRVRGNIFVVKLRDIIKVAPGEA